MSLDTYTSIKASVASWLDRSDLTDRIPDFIVLAESRLARRLRIRAVEKRAFTTFVSGQEYYSLPIDFIEARRVKIITPPVTTLSYMTPEQLDDKFSDGSTGQPSNYTIIGSEIQIKPIPGAESRLQIDYFTRLPPLTGNNETNWLTQNAPDLLLYGALVEAEAYLIGDERVPIWKGAFDEGIEEWNKREEKGRYSGSHIEIRSRTAP